MAACQADDAAQDHRIDALLEAHGRSAGALPISDVVLAEVFRTLRSACGQDKDAQCLASRSLLDEPAVAFADHEAVQVALQPYERNRCGFVACLVALGNIRPGAESTATVDRRADRLPGVRVILGSAARTARSGRGPCVRAYRSTP